MKSPIRLSVVIPVRNEERLIGQTLACLVASMDVLSARSGGVNTAGHDCVEVLVVDNLSEDRTASIVKSFSENHNIRYLQCARLGSACARNDGFREACGDVFVTIDGDTHIPPSALQHVLYCTDDLRYEAGIFRLAGAEGGLHAWMWWTFWEYVRCLPLARAKAMPGFMFCTRAVFERYGPFDESVQIGEEWPILASLYRDQPAKLVYDRSITALTSSRRMELQRFGYSRTLLKYVWAILHKSGRNGYTDCIR